MTRPTHLTRTLLMLAAVAWMAAACEDDPTNPPSNDTSTNPSDTSGGDSSGGDTEDDTADTSGGDSSGGDTEDDTADTSGGDSSGGDSSGDTADTSGGDSSDTDTVTPIDYTGLVINEVAASGDPNDWLELYNGTDHDIDLSPLWISDRLDREGALLPAGASVVAGGYYLIYLDSAGYPGFQFGSDEEAALFAPDGTLIDAIDWAEGQAPLNASFGRFPNGTGDFKTLNTVTPGYANQDNDAGATCGDGAVAGAEACDDGNVVEGDGCAAACVVEAGFTCQGEPSICASVCGDNVLAGTEECDDGNTDAGDGCAANCTIEVAPTTDVVINEAVHQAADGGPDWVELFNTAAADVDLSGWTLTDDSPDTNRYVFPAGTTVTAGGYLLIDRDTFGFGLGAADAVMLFNPDGARVDLADWVDGDAINGASFGRFPNGTGDFATLATPTPGTANVQ